MDLPWAGGKRPATDESACFLSFQVLKKTNEHNGLGVVSGDRIDVCVQLSDVRLTRLLVSFQQMLAPHSKQLKSLLERIERDDMGVKSDYIVQQYVSKDSDLPLLVMTTICFFFFRFSHSFPQVCRELAWFEGQKFDLRMASPIGLVLCDLERYDSFFV